jgi:ABC-type transport system involved in multi-copper enzyme maturation permease subunit
LRVEVKRMVRDPNPVWMRELRQSARLVSTPVVLALVTVLMTLLMASIGGIASVSLEPARVGVALFHTFFSLAFFVVAWVAPAVAAATIASERGNRTWEPLLLTGIGARAIAQGKFLAALSYVGLYVVMLAPVGGLTFLFGGITPVEVFAAFVFLALIAVLAVCFGLALSSALSSPAVAIVVTLLIAVPVSLVGYVVLGPVLAMGVHQLWPAVSSGLPVWLPSALVRADFGLDYLSLLVLGPLVCLTLPAWFFYEVTLANIQGPSDDRSSGLRRWLLVSLPVLALASGAPTLAVTHDQWISASWALTLTFSGLVVATFVIAGEPLGPSRRVLAAWDRTQASRLRRYLGPGVLRASVLVLGLGALLMLALIATGSAAELLDGGIDAETDALRVLCIGGPLTGFFVFLVGFTAWVRARGSSGALPRVALIAAVFLAAVGPWIVMAIGGVLTDSGPAALVLAAPSPTYAWVLAEWVSRGGSEAPVLLGAGVVCALVWPIVGGVLLGLAALRARRAIEAHHAAHAELEAVLTAEDKSRSA